MKTLILIIGLTAFCNLSYAQIQYDKRIELELNDGYVDEEVLLFGNKGIVLRSKSGNNANDDRLWSYKLYDTGLDLAGEASISIPRSLKEDETFNDSNFSYTIFKNRRGEYNLLRIEASTLEYSNTKGKLPRGCYISQMTALGDMAYFKSTLKGKPFLFAVNLVTGQQTPIPVEVRGVNSKNITLKDFQLISKTNEIMLHVDVKIDRYSSNTYLLRLNEKGGVKDNLLISSGVDEVLLDVTSSSIGPDEYILTGTFSKKNRTLAEGIYFSRVKNQTVEFIKFYNFLDLENFLSYLPERRQERIEKRKEKREAKGKEYNLSYYIEPHEIIVKDDGYIYVGEAYYPTYRTETYTTTSTVNGVTTTTTHSRTVFDGYRYTHAFIAKYDKAGNMQWDQTFELWPTYKPFTVKQFVNISENIDQELKLSFASRGAISTLVIGQDGEIASKTESEPIETLFSEDKTRRSFADMDFWYDNYFVSYGNQKIKNTENKSVDRKRKVYFISKISFN